MVIPAAPLNFVNATNDAVQSPTIDTALTFATNISESGTAITHTAGSSDFVITETGTYEIIYNSTATPTTAAATPVTAELSLQQDGTEISGTISSNTLTASGDTAALNGSTILNVTTAPSTITLVNGATDIDYSNSTLIIRKLIKTV